MEGAGKAARNGEAAMEQGAGGRPRGDAGESARKSVSKDDRDQGGGRSRGLAAGANPFDLLHPAVAVVYFAALLVLAMTTMHPVYLMLAWAGSLSCRAGMHGWHEAAGTLRWQLPVVAIIALANCLFVGSGSTMILQIGVRAFYAEALFYGACSGLMLCCVLLVFQNASDVLTSDKVMAVLGRRLPTVSLMVSMTMRLVPQFARRGDEIRDTARACTAAAGPRDHPMGELEDDEAAPGTDKDGAEEDEMAEGEAGEGGADEEGGVRRRRREAKSSRRRGRIRESLRLVTVLMGWGMEDSLETADAMKARGWGAAERRTTYQRYRFRRTDTAALIAVVLLAVASAATAWTAVGELSFYPVISGLAPWWSYAPFALFAFAPSILSALIGEEDA